MNKIMFFAHDPGGANAIAPLVEPLFDRGHSVFIYALGPAVKILEKKINIPVTLFDFDILQDINPDYLVTGTCSNDKTERLLWRWAKNKGIKSMAILDHWCNYGIRFSQYGLQEISKFDRSYDILPDSICVMDEFAKSEMIKEGIPSECIYPFGNPHFEEIIKTSPSQIEARNLLGIGNEYVITFASEPYTEDYGFGPEKKVFEEILECIGDRDDIKIILKLHPKESVLKYKESIDSFPNIMVEHFVSSLTVIMASDLIISMTSMLLIESVLLNKRAISYQLGEANKEKYILTRNEILPFINTKIDFYKHLLQNVDSIENIEYDMKTNETVVENIILFIEKNIKGV